RMRHVEAGVALFPAHHFLTCRPGFATHTLQGADRKDGMAIAFTFPGQGSQAVGMGRDLAEAFPEARRVFEEVDDALAQKLSTIMWEGPEETLTLTANAQPALMAVSLAAVRSLESRGVSLPGKVAYVAGHSLG